MDAGLTIKPLIHQYAKTDDGLGAWHELRDYFLESSDQRRPNIQAEIMASKKDYYKANKLRQDDNWRSRR
jgi:hypothetical protein